jgi:CheY-like chemotaxis protein
MNSDDQTPVIVIEDCDEDFMVIRDSLTNHARAHPIVHFNESQTARAWLERASQKARLILLDLNLPGERGHSLLQTLKSHPRHKTTPVIVLSTSDDPSDISYCYQYGANSYHKKPLEVERFSRTVQNIADYWLNSAHFAKS